MTHICATGTSVFDDDDILRPIAIRPIEIDAPDVPESAAPISADWIETERLLGDAWVRYINGQLSREGYRAVCDAIVERGR